MKLIPAFAIFIVAVLSNSCKPSSKAIVVGTRINKEKVIPGQTKVKKVFISVMTSDESLKSVMENDLAEAAAAKGIQSEKSYYEFGPIRSIENRPPKDLVLKQIRKYGCDAIFVVALLDVKSETTYTPSVQNYAPYPYGAYGTFSTFYITTADIYTPGYYTTEHTYFIRSNLYDATTEDMLLSMDTKIINLSSIEKSSKQYTEALIEELEKQGFLKH